MTSKMQRIIFSLTVLFVFLLWEETGYANDNLPLPATANIQIAITGATNDNRYFLCLPSIGCLSIKAGENGEVFKMMTPITLNRLFLSDLAKQQLSYAEAPKSCAQEVGLKQTVTIKGKLVTDRKNVLNIENLSCTIKKQ